MLKSNVKYIIDEPCLMSEWDFQKNIGVYPEKITIGSNKKVWWKCVNGHEWQATINNRSNSRGCPYCSNRRVLVGYNDLKTTAPHLALEWNNEKNFPLTPENVMRGSGKKVWWICPNGHEYQASVMHRWNGTNCPICRLGRQTSFAEQALYFYIKKMFPDAINRALNIIDNRMELDIYIPSIHCAIEYDGFFWHSQQKAKKRENKKYLKCLEHGIYLIRIQEVKKNDKLTSVVYSGGALPKEDAKSNKTFYIQDNEKKEDLNRLIITVLHEINLKRYSFTSIKKIAPFNFNVNVKRDEIKIRKNMQCLQGKPLSETHPNIAQEWHTTKNESLTPAMFSAGSDYRAWWQCSLCKNEWQTSIGHRVKGTGCPQCYRDRIKKQNPKSKPIYQYSLQGEFIKKWDSISLAKEQLHISNISTCANHIRGQAGGYCWRYDYKERIKPYKDSRKKTILQMNEEGKTISEFSSLSEAEKILKIPATSISKALKGEYEKAGGFYWRFKKENN